MASERTRSRRQLADDGNAKYIVLAVIAVLVLVLVVWALFFKPYPATSAGSLPPGGSAATSEPTVEPSPAATIEPATPPPTAAFIGDSYTGGTGASSEATRWVALVAAEQGWAAINLGRGGTGYGLAGDGDLATQACGLERCPSYLEMIPEAAAAAPDIVVVSGGRNEAEADPEEVAGEIDAFYAELRASLPDATIIATSPVWDDDATPESIIAMQAAVRAAVERVGGRYLDLGAPLASAPGLVVEDGVHPNDAGHRALADAVNALL